MKGDGADSRRIATAGSKTVAAAPNPQGKGQVGFLRDWDYSAPRGVVAKPAPQVLADYFTSLLVLSATFKFEPTFGKDYYLYYENQHWALSLISPDEWHKPEKQKNFVGTCVLHDDSTWSLAPSENLTNGGVVADAVSLFFDQFVDRLQTSDPLEAGLPIYEANLPYYQRLFAAALSRSLKQSLGLGGQQNRPAQNWLDRISGDVRQLLGPGKS